MPTYQYACTECGEHLEVVQKFSDDPLTLCAACGGKLRKLFSAVGIVFKGSGFYRTDSRSGSVSPGASKPSNGSAPAASSDSGSSSSSDGASSSSSSAEKPPSSGGGSSSADSKVA